MSIKIEGMKEVQAKLNRIKDVDKFFNKETKDTASWTMNSLMKATPFDKLSGLAHTRNMWEFPRKLGNSVYAIDNIKTSSDGKYSIAGILNDGRKEAKAKPGKFLFIPFSEKAKLKKVGDDIPKDWKRGTKDNKGDSDIDYVLAKKSKAVAPTKFIDKIVEKSHRVLTKLIIKKIKKVFR